jgi:hypothetical protein
MAVPYYTGRSRDESDTRAPKRPRDMDESKATAENEIDVPGWSGFPESERATSENGGGGDYEEWVDYEAGELEGPGEFKSRPSLPNERSDNRVMVGNEETSVDKVLRIQKNRLGDGS